MTSVAINGSLTTGHGSYGPATLISTQTKFFVSGLAVIINGNKATNHGHSPVGECIATQTKFFISGVPVVIVGDKLTDGDTVATGSPKFFIN